MSVLLNASGAQAQVTLKELNAPTVGIGLDSGKAFLNVVSKRTVLFGVDSLGGVGRPTVTRFDKTGVLQNGGFDPAYGANTAGNFLYQNQPIEPKMIWYGNKGAFRAGGVYTGDSKPTLGSISANPFPYNGPDLASTIDLSLNNERDYYDTLSFQRFWDNREFTRTASRDLIGDFSFASGANTRASGQFSTAMGYQTQALGHFSTALGFKSWAVGDQSIVLGSRSAAGYKRARPNGTSLGSNSNGVSASESDSSPAFAICVGNYSYAYGARSLVLGNNSYAGGAYNVAIGTGSATGTLDYLNSSFKAESFKPDRDVYKPSGSDSDPTSVPQYAYAFGYVARASGNYSMALGNKAQANGESSMAMGQSAQTNNTNAVAIGNQANAAGNSAFSIGNQTQASGPSSTALGNSTQASGQFSTALGYQTQAGGLNTMATGYLSIASGETSTAIGNQAHAIGISTISLGTSTTATGNFATALGRQSLASGNNATALGNQTQAIGIGATSLGYSTTATGNYSMAMGHFTKTNAFGATTMGMATTAGGQGATAMGNTTTASGEASTAMGFSTLASGQYATAMGGNTQSRGVAAVSMGISTTASGYNAIAAGMSSLASGVQSVAMGQSVTANGNNSVAIGSFVSTGGKSGSVILGDALPIPFQNTNTNQMLMRFVGGYVLHTSPQPQDNTPPGQLGPPGTSIGVALLPNGNAWTTISDSTRKENFRPADGASFLRKIGQMRLGSWNYKGQDVRTLRHYGPMAQDFFAAFGHDALGTIGEDKVINQADFDGVNLIAIKALIQEVEQLKAANQQLKTDNGQLRTQLENTRQQGQQVEDRLSKLEALLTSQPASPSVNLAQKP